MPVFSASLRCNSGVIHAMLGAAEDSKAKADVEIAMAMQKHQTNCPETVLYVSATRTISLGLNWELYAFPYVSTLLSTRGLLGYHTKKKDGFVLWAYSVREDVSNISFISLPVPLAVYMRKQRVLQRQYERRELPSELQSVAREILT